MANISLKNVMKTYAGGDAAVKDLNLELRDGEFLVLAGPAGSGKSTVVHLIAGLEEPSAGTLTMDGESLKDVPPRERDVAMVFQNNILYPDMTVYENLEFGLRMRKISPEICGERIERTAEILGLTEILQQKPGEIGEKQRQMTAVGRAIVHNPGVLLLDEPFLNLDAELRKKMRIELERLHRELNLTILYATEDQNEAAALGDRVAIMRDGTLQQIDTPQRVYENPANLFVAGFAGNPRINLMECNVREKDGNAVLVFGDRELSLPADCSSLLKQNGYMDRRIVAGLRPEALRLVKTREANRMEATVSRYETVGENVYVYFEIGDTEGAVRVERQTAVKQGDIISLVPDMMKLHLFDRDTGALITADKQRGL